MNRNNRLEDVRSFELLDTGPEKELDEITELASLICGTPISLITVLDEQRQWFKSKKGTEQREAAIGDSFCQFILQKPNEMLIVKDTLEDPRFKDNKLVVGEPNIRFYAGAPLITQNNNVLGTLCILDVKPKEISEDQKKALQILARKAMDYIEFRKLIKSQSSAIELNTQRLIKITENLPLGIFEMRVDMSGNMKFTFLSKGMKTVHPNVKLKDWLEDPNIGFSLMHPEDIEPLKVSLANAIAKQENLYHEYRVMHGSDFHWHAISGKPEKAENGETIIYGSFTDVTHHFEYEEALEQISFDISHVLRGPVSTMLGITNLLETEHRLSERDIKEYSSLIQTIAKELDDFTRKLNDIYTDKRKSIANNSNRFKI